MDHPRGRKTSGRKKLKHGRKIHWVLKKRLEAQKPIQKAMVWHILGLILMLSHACKPIVGGNKTLKRPGLA